MKYQYSSPQPHLTDGEFQEWLSLVHTLSTGSGISRHLPRPETLPEAWAYKPNMPAPFVSMASTPLVSTAEQSPYGRMNIPTSALYVRSIDVHDDRPYDPWTLEPYSVVPRSVLDREAYTRAERQRQTLDRGRKGYVQGFSTIKAFGPPETRFRTFNPDPSFADICGAFHYHYYS